MGALWEPSGGIRGALLEGLRGFCGCAVGPFSFAPGARFCQPVDIKHSFWGTNYHPNRWPGDPIRGHCWGTLCARWAHARGTLGIHPTSHSYSVRGSGHSFYCRNSVFFKLKSVHETASQGPDFDENCRNSNSGTGRVHLRPPWVPGRPKFARTN